MQAGSTRKPYISDWKSCLSEQVCSQLRVHTDVSKTIFEDKGQNVLEQALHLFDWVSVYIPELSSVATSTVHNLDYLKDELSKK